MCEHEFIFRDEFGNGLVYLIDGTPELRLKYGYPDHAQQPTWVPAAAVWANNRIEKGEADLPDSFEYKAEYSHYALRVGEEQLLVVVHPDVQPELALTDALSRTANGEYGDTLSQETVRLAQDLFETWEEGLKEQEPTC